MASDFGSPTSSDDASADEVLPQSRMEALQSYVISHSSGVLFSLKLCYSTRKSGLGS
jgi:hypothetical protein